MSKSSFERVEVSVIMPAYNAEKFIGKAIDSIISQSFEDWELIIINDGSTDNTELIISDYVNSNDKISQYNQENKGESLARWRGVKKSKGKYIYFIDADDIACVNSLSVLYKKLEDNNHCIASYGNYLRVNNNGELVFPYGKDLNNLHCTGNINFLEKLLQSSFLAIGAVLIRKDKIIESDILVKTQYSEDWVMWVNLALKGEFTYIGDALVKRRIHKKSQTQSNLDIKDWLEAVNIIFDNKNLLNVFTKKKIQNFRNHRIAFCNFSIACKYCAVKDFENAELHLKNSIKIAYWKYMKVWLLYFFVRIKWIPKIIFNHFG